LNSSQLQLLDMGWSSPDSLLTRLFSGDPLVVLIAFLVTIALPSLVHLYFYTQSARTKAAPTFLLLGPSGAGKTSLVSLVGSSIPLYRHFDS
jgi:signal recognition particle receptor subunit beta